MRCRSVYFTAPYQVEVRDEPLPEPQPDQALVETLVSAISPGSELLVYQGKFPTDLVLDENIAALSGGFTYPLRYGYSAIGQVIAHGGGVERAWLGRRVFSFQPHTSRFVARTAELQVVPEQLDLLDAVFLPNMETAVSLVMDGAPLIGERVVVFGQGVIGLLTTALLGRFPLASLVTLDCHANRRQASQALGAHHSLPADLPDSLRELRTLQPDGADLVYELSGSPAVLDQAIAAAGFGGRVVIGSWYGQKRAPLDLGGRFHRSRIRLISSQVSTLAPEHSARWNKARRFGAAWEMLRQAHPARLITHCLPISQAQQAYELLDRQPGQAIQVIFEYDRQQMLPVEN
jgi:2-desacetyl-2-hydroxyethyl bacteriochlorophyllide A dehydrogenase